MNKYVLFFLCNLFLLLVLQNLTPVIFASSNNLCDLRYSPVIEGLTRKYNTSDTVGHTVLTTTIAKVEGNSYEFIQNRLGETIKSSVITTYTCGNDGKRSWTVEGNMESINQAGQAIKTTMHEKRNGIILPPDDQWIVGKTFNTTMNYETVNSQPDGSEVISKGVQNYSYTLVGMEQITVPAGNFNAFRINTVYSQSGTVTTPNGDIPFSDDGNSESWYAEGVGQIKTILYSNHGKTESWAELASYSPGSTIFPLKIPMPTVTPPGSCQISVDEQAKRQKEIKVLKDKYRVEIKDTNVCGQYPECGTARNLSSSELNAIATVFGNLPENFMNKINSRNLNSIGVLSGNENGKLDHIDKLCCSSDGNENNFTSFYDYPQANNGNKGTIRFCGDRGLGIFTSGVTGVGPNADTFSGVFIHELTHALQGFTATSDLYKTPLVVDWMKATGWAGSCTPNFGCLWSEANSIGNHPPTGYGNTNPLEDMAESVRYYYLDPSSLKAASPARYQFIKDYIMGGKEF